MSISNDSQAPKGLNSSGPIAVGGSGNSSINNLKNIKTATANAKANSKLGELNDWFMTYVGSTGKYSGTADSSTATTKMSYFRNAEIVGFSVQMRNESLNAAYNNNNNGQLKVRPYFGHQDGKLKFQLTGSGYNATKTPSYGGTSTFTGINGGTNTSSPKGEYFLKLTSTTDNITTTLQMGMFMGYHTTAGKMRGTTTMATNDQDYPFTSPSSGSFGSTQYFLLGIPDPSGRSYGASYSYAGNT